MTKCLAQNNKSCRIPKVRTHVQKAQRPLPVIVNFKSFPFRYPGASRGPFVHIHPETPRWDESSRLHLKREKPRRNSWTMKALSACRRMFQSAHLHFELGCCSAMHFVKWNERTPPRNDCWSKLAEICWLERKQVWPRLTHHFSLHLTFRLGIPCDPLIGSTPCARHFPMNAWCCFETPGSMRLDSGHKPNNCNL